MSNDNFSHSRRRIRSFSPTAGFAACIALLAACGGAVSGGESAGNEAGGSGANSTSASSGGGSNDTTTSSAGGSGTSGLTATGGGSGTTGGGASVSSSGTTGGASSSSAGTGTTGYSDTGYDGYVTTGYGVTGNVGTSTGYADTGTDIIVGTAGGTTGVGTAGTVSGQSGTVGGDSATTGASAGSTTGCTLPPVDATPVDQVYQMNAIVLWSDQIAIGTSSTAGTGSSGSASSTGAVTGTDGISAPTYLNIIIGTPTPACSNPYATTGCQGWEATISVPQEDLAVGIYPLGNGISTSFGEWMNECGTNAGSSGGAGGSVGGVSGGNGYCMPGYLHIIEVTSTYVRFQVKGLNSFGQLVDGYYQAATCFVR